MQRSLLIYQVGWQDVILCKVHFYLYGEAYARYLLHLILVVRQ
jgi:hypothetical protein